MADDNPENRYHCDACNKDFANEEGLKQHNRDKHGIGKEKKDKKIMPKDDRDKAIDKVVKKRKTMRIIKYTIPIILIIAIVAVAVVYIPKREDLTGIGPVNSQHIHADFAIYINGTELNFNDNKYFVGELHGKYSHLHAPHATLLHVHATRVSIGIFMNSIKQPFNNTCITDQAGEDFCNDNENTIKFYVNGEPNYEFDKYIVKDKDKILISYGNESDLKEQLASITNLAEAASQGLISG